MRKISENKKTPVIAIIGFWSIMILLYVLGAIFLPSKANAQSNILKYSTFYAAVNGGTSLSDDQAWSVTSGILEESITHDVSTKMGILDKIADIEKEMGRTQKNKGEPPIRL